ncbi:ATP-binding cassette domain-containing protein [Candidatus Cytomitobacter primus]|uniref:ATP-binding cassette domain-containing protein n=1 Tax=Candidatus Cytomitobacter primus TaxID=2066024 RepID=A0A5C0UE76_9PROT|nr:ATP-binding cassette domain-containing protein [Candidatus Cytomitobacter primus]QEK38338.1 ATP-binding cassette domain-containing protein [Candidatus Cytomitobacter primus]
MLLNYKKIPIYLILLNLLSISIIVYISFVINGWYSSFYSVLATRNADLLYLIFIFVAYNAISHISMSIKEFIECSIAIKWRKNITYNLVEKIKPSLIDIANPDQRLCEDTEEFTSYTVRLISDLILNAISLIIFIVILFRVTSFLSGIKLVFGMVSYTLFCNYILSKYIKKYTLYYGEIDEVNEANLRSDVYELHQAKYGFSSALKNVIYSIFNALFLNKIRYFKYKSALSFLQKFFDDNIGMILPYFLMYYFTNDGAWDIGIIMQVVHCLVTIKFRMMFFSENIQKISVMKIGYIRLKQYIHNVLANQSTNLQCDKSLNLQLKFEKIIAEDKLLLKNIKFSIEKGESVCLYGESGIGKTTLLRYINNSIKNAKGQISYDGTMRCLCLQNLQNYILLMRKNKVEYLSQGELQQECISCLITDKPDWIVWDEFCLGLSQQSKEKAFNRLKSCLINTGLIILSQDKLDFCDKSIALERFK